MPFRLKVSVVILFSFLGLLLIGPLIIPIPPLADTVPERSLADPDSRFISVNGIEVHYKTAGNPEEGPSFVLLHGFGSSLYSWQKVMDDLSSYGFVVAFDRPAFGLTERPLPGDWQGRNPYSSEAQVELTLELMDALGVQEAVLVGNSSGGAVAAELGLSHPERVLGLLLADAAIYRMGGPPRWSRWLLHTPQLNRLGPLFMRQLAGAPGQGFLEAAWSDPNRIDEATREAYRKPLRAENWDRALWELSKASREAALEERLGGLERPVLVLSGDGDRIVPPDLSERLSSDLPQAEYALLPGCGHLPQEECPELFMEVVDRWLRTEGFVGDASSESAGVLFLAFSGKKAVLD